MEITKKGIFFSLTSLLIIGVLFVTVQSDANRRSAEFTQLQIQDFQSDVNKLQTRQLPELLESYVRKSLDEIAKKNYALLNDHTTPQGHGKQLSDCLLSHKKNAVATTEKEEDNDLSVGQPECVAESKLNFSKVLLDVEDALKGQQYNASIRLVSVNVSQRGAWDLNIQGVFEVDIEKNTKDIRSKQEVEVFTSTPIAGLIDPLSSYHRGELYTIKRSLKRTDNKDDLFFYSHARNGSYVAAGIGPSYLERLEGNSISSSIEGITSLITQTKSGSEENYSVDFGNRIIGENDCVYWFNATKEDQGEEEYLSLSTSQIVAYREVTGYDINNLVVDSSDDCDEITT
jgi:hypothetical protein